MKSLQDRILSPLGRFVSNRPLISFLVLIALLFGLIYAGSLSRNQKIDSNQKDAIAKTVDVYSVNSSSTIDATGTVKKTGEVTIVAQSAGIMQNIDAVVGKSVSRGSVLGYVSTSYGGGNVANIQKGIAQRQYQNAKNTYQDQLNLLNNQRDLAERAANQAEDLREISRLSLQDTRNLIGGNDQILETINKQLMELESINSDGTQSATISQLRQAKQQVESGQAQLRGALRQTEYSSNEESQPAELSNLQRDATLKQLGLQEKGLALSLEIAKLQSELASLQAALSYPSSPISGIVQRVFVKPYQSVQPGTPLFIIAGGNNSAEITVSVSRDTALMVSRSQSSQLIINNQEVAVTPKYVSTMATDAKMYSVTFHVDDEIAQSLSDGEMIRARLQLFSQQSNLFVPIDAVYQMEERADVFLIADGKVVSREVKLGEVYAGTVAVLSGLTSGDAVILDRTVVEGELVKPRE